jgi:hypothetical protein
MDLTTILGGPATDPNNFVIFAVRTQSEDIPEVLSNHENQVEARAAYNTKLFTAQSVA